MRKYIVIVLTGLLVSGIAYSKAFDGLRFGAPAVEGRSTIYQPQAGDIVLDTVDDTFYGRTTTSTWVPFGSAAATIPAGTILPYGGTSAPPGFLMADGSPVDRTTYADLFTAIGTAFGTGDGVNTFNLPDLRGRFMRGVDSSGLSRDAGPRTATNGG